MTIDGTSYGKATLPITFQWIQGSIHSFTFNSPLTIENKRYVWTNTTGITTLQNGTLTATAAGTITGYYETQYLVTFNTTLPDLTVLSIPGVPTKLLPGQNIFGAYYAANEVLLAGPAPNAVSEANKTKYVFNEWTIDGNTLTTSPNISLLVDAPHDIGVIYGTDQLLTINAIGVNEPFIAAVKIVASPPVIRMLTPAASVQQWISLNAQTTTTVSTVNIIGHGDWAIFKGWTGQVEQNTKTIFFNMKSPTTLNAVFFKVNPVAESIAYSLIAGMATMIILSVINRRKPAQDRQKPTRNRLSNGNRRCSPHRGSCSKRRCSRWIRHRNQQTP